MSFVEINSLRGSQKLSSCSLVFCDEVMLDYWWWVVRVTGEVSVSCVAVTSPAPPVSGARVLSAGQGCNTTS